MEKGMVVRCDHPANSFAIWECFSKSAKGQTAMDIFPLIQILIGIFTAAAAISQQIPFSEIIRSGNRRSIRSSRLLWAV